MSSPPPYIRTVNNPTGNVYINPETNIPTQIVPAGALSTSGVWVPILSDDSGVVYTQDGSSMVSGTPHFDDAEFETTPGEPQTLIDGVVPDNVSRAISQVQVVTRVTGSYAILADGVMIGSGRTGPGGTGHFTFSPPRPIAAGVEYQVQFTSRLNSPVQSVECYLQATDSAAS
jgi:hypothetical protein